MMLPQVEKQTLPTCCCCTCTKSWCKAMRPSWNSSFPGVQWVYILGALLSVHCAIKEAYPRRTHLKHCPPPAFPPPQLNGASVLCTVPLGVSAHGHCCSEHAAKAARQGIIFRASAGRVLTCVNLSDPICLGRPLDQLFSAAVLPGSYKKMTPERRVMGPALGMQAQCPDGLIFFSTSVRVRDALPDKFTWKRNNPWNRVLPRDGICSCLIEYVDGSDSPGKIQHEAFAKAVDGVNENERQRNTVGFPGASHQPNFAELKLAKLCFLFPSLSPVTLAAAQKINLL